MSAAPFNPSAPDPLDGAYTAEWLMRQVFPPVEYVVPGLIPEGLTMLVAPPKVGKSWMVLGIAAAAATGGKAFRAIGVKQRPVLYLALEDGPRRLQGRLHKLGMPAGPRNMLLKTSLVASALDTIDAFLQRHADEQPLVILDTLGKIRGHSTTSDAYGRDYTQVSALKDLVDAVPGSSLIVVHHTNKAEHHDFLNSVSGTHGLAGAADSVLAIQRDRNSTEATLHVTSRDAAEGQYALTLVDGTTWQLDGDGLQSSSERAALRALTGGLGDEMTKLVETVSRHPEGIKRRDIATLHPEMDEGTLGKNLRRALDAGRISNPSRGVYTPAISAISATTDEESTPSNVALMAVVAPLHKEGATDEH